MTAVNVVIVDDHPAIRAGVAGLLDVEPGLECVATTGTAAGGLDAARSCSAAVVVADYELPDGDGLTLCSDLKALPSPPGVILYSAFVRPRLIPAAAIAGLDAMVDKGDATDSLLAAIRAVADGHARLPAAPPEVTERCLEKLDTADIPLFGMAVNGIDSAEIAEVLGLEPDAARRRVRAMLGRLQERDRDGVAFGSSARVGSLSDRQA